jgi:ATP-dependent exoDNAse (exonuclease V) beta subunit
MRAGAFDNEATRYGHWWHKLLERLDWSQEPAQWNAIFETALGHVPDRTLAQRHWELFQAHTAGEDDFRKRLGAAAFVAHAEFPFLLKLGKSAALEGVIDLVLFAPERRRALIIDWKTNAVDLQRAPSLRGKYHSQLAAYWKAVSEITGFEVEAGLFATAVGRLMLYDRGELAAEWERLEQLPAADLSNAVATPDA